MTWVTICPRCGRNRAFNHAAGVCYECAPTERVGVSQMNGMDYPCPQCHNSREETMRLRIEITEVKAECNRLATELAAVKAQSLRVVPVGDPTTATLATGNYDFIMRDGEVYMQEPYLWDWVCLDGTCPDLMDQAIVQPVELRSWE